MKIKNVENDFVKNGYFIAKIFDDLIINEYGETFKDICKIQMKKLGLNSNINSIDSIVKTIEKKNSKVLDECIQMMRNTSIGHKLASNNNLINISKKLLKNKKLSNIISGPSMFINFPNSVRRKYTWHSEQNWYPKRRNFINVWYPIFRYRKKNESMALKVSSHKKDWFYFSEYEGYKGKTNKDALVQYEIPEKFVKEFKTISPEVKKNEGLFFSGKIVHRSIDSKNNIFYTLIFRIYDYTNDLTLSSNWADIPYNRNSFGIPDINVDI